MLSPCFGSRGTVGPRAKELPVAAGAEPVGLGVEGALASSAPPPAAPEAEQHHGADQRTRSRQRGHDRLPSRALSSYQFMIIRVVARSAGLGTYFVIGNCVSPQTTGVCPQSSAGELSPRGESTFSTVLVAGGGPGAHAPP